MRTKKTKATKKVAKRGRPKGSTKTKNVVVKSGKKTLVIKPKAFKTAEKLFKKAKATVKETADVLENTKVAFTKKQKVAKQTKIEEPKVKVIKPIPSGVACTGCGEDIPKQRIDACKGTTKCVKCSDVKTKKPIIVNHGTGDNIYQEVVIVDDETYRKHLKAEEATRRALGKPSLNSSLDNEDRIEKGNDKFITPEK